MPSDGREKILETDLVGENLREREHCDAGQTCFQQEAQGYAFLVEGLLSAEKEWKMMMASHL